MAKMLPVIPVVKPDARFQPVWVGDVAEAVARAAVDSGQYGGKTFELGGPRVYSFEVLVGWIAEYIRSRRTLLSLTDSVAELITAFEFLSGEPFTADLWLILKRENEVSQRATGVAGFGVATAAGESQSPRAVQQ